MWKRDTAKILIFLVYITPWILAPLNKIGDWEKYRLKSEYHRFDLRCTEFDVVFTVYTWTK